MEEVNSKIFLNIDEMAGRLGVRKSWLYKHTMQKGPGAIPRIRLGKYLRFNEEDVIEWVKKQSEAALQ